MNEPRASEARNHEFAEVMTPGDLSPERLVIGDLKSVQLNMTAELGKAFLTVREVLELKEGAVVPLDKIASTMQILIIAG